MGCPPTASACRKQGGLRHVPLGSGWKVRLHQPTRSVSGYARHFATSPVGALQNRSPFRVKTRIPPFWAYVSLPQLRTYGRMKLRRCVPILLQKSFCTGDQKFSGLWTRFSCKDVGGGTSSPNDKLADDPGNAIEGTRISGRRSDFLTAEKLAPENLGLLQQYLP